MPRISDQLIEEVLQKTDLVDVVSETVALSKQGKSYFGLCPFHNEKTPSFSVDPERGIYTCFSCGEKGNAITFKQKTQNLSFVEAVEVLADTANVSFDFSSMKKEKPFQSLYKINQNALEFYRLYLESTKQGQVAKEYLQDRGIEKDIIEYFELGLSPKEYDVLYKTLIDKDFLASDMHDLGLIKLSSKDTFYDLFRDRVMIPIHNEQGDVVGFSGRIYDSQDKTAKYINSPQTKIFTKSQVLYNLHRAINAIKMMDRAVLFEGYMDVIAAHKAGIKEAVASMGTSLTKDQVRLLSKYTKNILICYDGDNAGIEATDRAIKMFQASGFTVKVVMLPNKMDPDDYITKHGSTALNTYINDQWIDTIEFSYLKSNMAIDFSKLLDIERFKKTIFDLIKNSSNTIIESYIKRLSQDINISVDSIRQDFNQYTKRNIQNIGHQLKKKVETIDNKYVNAERRMVTYFKEEVTYVKRFIQEFGPVFCIDSRVREIKELIEDIYFHSGLPAEDINDVGERLEKIMNEQQKAFHDKYLVNPNLDVIKKEYDDLFDTMQKYQEDVQLELLEEQIRQADTIEEKIRLANYRDIRIKEERHGKR